MPRGFMDDLEGKIIYEEVHESGLWEDIFSADLYCEESLLPNIREHRVRRIADDFSGYVSSEGIGKIPKPFFHVIPERAFTLVRNRDEAFGNVHGIHIIVRSFVLFQVLIQKNFPNPLTSSHIYVKIKTESIT